MIHLVTLINPVPQAKRERIATLTRLEDTVKKKLAEEAARRPPRTKQQKLQKQMELRLKVRGLRASRAPCQPGSAPAHRCATARAPASRLAPRAMVA